MHLNAEIEMFNTTTIIIIIININIVNYSDAL